MEKLLVRTFDKYIETRTPQNGTSYHNAKCMMSMHGYWANLGDRMIVFKCYKFNESNEKNNHPAKHFTVISSSTHAESFVYLIILLLGAYSAIFKHNLMSQ